MFEELDEDGDGLVSFDEFLHGLFVAKDIQQSDLETDLEQHHSTPYNHESQKVRIRFYHLFLL